LAVVKIVIYIKIS